MWRTAVVSTSGKEVAMSAAAVSGAIGGGEVPVSSGCDEWMLDSESLMFDFVVGESAGIRNLTVTESADTVLYPLTE
jgi:hypothetical protein